MGNSSVTFHCEDQGEDDEERTDDDLCVGPPAGGACHDDANLVFTIREREQMVTRSMKLMGKRNILLFFPALPSHAATARRPMAARSWLAAPKSPQILANPPMPREMPRMTVRIVANRDSP